MMEGMTATTGYDSNVVARGLELLLVENDPRKSYSHFSSAIEGHESLTLREEERNKSIQFRDVAGSVLIRMELENGDNFAKLGRYGSALEAYSSIRSSSTVPIMVQFQMKNNAGACLARLGRKEEALAMQLKAFTLNPSSVKTLKNIAILLADLGYHEEAIVAFDGYLRIHPESYSALCGKAGCLKDLRLYSKSEIIAEQAQLLDPQLLRGRCAHDLRKFCHEELSKSKHSKKDIPVVESKLPPLVSYFSISTSHIHNTEFNFEAWLASVQSTFGDTNIYEDFRLPHTDGNGTQFNNILEGQQVVLSPETKYEDKATLFAVRIPGQEMVVNSTPIKQDTKLIDQRWPTDRIPKGTAITSRTDMAQEKNPSNQPAHIMRQESIPSRVPHVMHQTLRPATSILSQPRIPTTFIGSGATFTSINDPVVKMKYPISLGIRKETDGPVINPSRRETSEAWMRSPLSHSMYAQISRRLEAPDTDSVSHHSIHDTTAARHRAQDDESTHTASLHSPALSLRTPTKASAVPRAAASHRDQQPQKEQSLPVSATSIISEQRNLSRNESAPASFKSVPPGNLSSKSYSSESRELRNINPNELVYLDGRHNNEISRFPEDAPISHRSSSSISSIATDSMILPSQSGKPMRRQHAPQEAKHVKEKVDSYFAHDPCSSRSTRTIDRTDEYNWVSGAVTFQNRKDRDQTAMPSVDLPSPNMSATDVKPTLMIPYQTLRHLSTSVESNASSIDTSHKENNLYEDEFEQIFQMTRDQWNALPTWQQARKKKQVGLF